jgi:hypothetical protein
METNNEMSKTLMIAKIFYIALIAAILVYANILFGILLHEVSGPIFPISNSTLTILTVVLSVVALCVIVTGLFFLPRLMLKSLIKAYQKNSIALLLLTIFLAAIFESVAIYGLILGILGAGAQITVPFFVVSAGLLILTFPTEKRWKKMMGPRDIYSKYEEKRQS